MDAEEKLSSDRSKQEASQTINASKYLDKTAWARVPIYFALSKYTLPIFYQRPLIPRNDFCVSPIQFYREQTFHKLFYFSKSRNTVQASFVTLTAFVLCERILIPVNRKDRKGLKRGLIRGAFPPYDLSVARKRQHLYTRNSCRYTAIGHSRAGLRHTYTRTTRTRYSDTKAGQAADRGLAREPLSMLVHVQPVRRFTVRRILRRRPLRRGQTSLWIL